MIMESVLTCPHCEYKQSETLFESISPTNFRCEDCQKKVKINIGECCIYCEYGDSPCLQAQVVGSSCCGDD